MEKSSQQESFKLRDFLDIQGSQQWLICRYGKMDKRTDGSEFSKTMIYFYQLPFISNIVYLTACAFIRS